MHLRKLLLDLKNDGKKIVGYGAPAKGNTLLNYFEIGSDLLDYVVDDSPWKQGLLTPGKHIPVVSIEKIAETKPDYILILAWNFAEPIMKKLDFAKSYGAKFIIPVPKPQIVD
jgi:ABC-type Fe3+-hydroxamate transport system substrate-binding protein